MDINEFLSVPIDPITRDDVENAFFMMSPFDDELVKCCRLGKNNLEDTVDRVIDSFSLFKSIELENKVKEVVPTISHMCIGVIPYNFNMQFVNNSKNEVKPLIICPKVIDDGSYPFLGHEVNHCLKDINIKERKLRDRLSEVIPMFYELICYHNEDDVSIKDEIIRRRYNLLLADKNEDNESIRRLQYFNSYYYALALYSRYKKDKLMVLRLASRVLLGEINTLTMLETLNIYNKDVDKEVGREFYEIKEYVYR